MTQPTLFGTNERPTHRPVRETSRAAYQAGKERWTGRKLNVLTWLERYEFGGRIEPTSAELTRAVMASETDWHKWPEKLFLSQWTSMLLYIRRGLSDLVKVAAVENPKGVDGKLLKRPCAVTGSLCYVWRVRQR